jgi:hypothetical protein
MGFRADLAVAIDNFDLEEFARAHGAEATSKADELVMRCPRCAKADKLCINLERRAWHCWYCSSDKGGGGGRGGLLDLVALVEGLGRREATYAVIERAKSIPIADLDALQRKALKTMGPRKQVPKFAWALPIDWPSHWRHIVPHDPDCDEFMVKRGISLADVIQFRLVYCTAGRYRGRVVFPVIERGNLVYFQARAIWGKEAYSGEVFRKAINPHKDENCQTTSSDVLLNLDIARLHERVAIVEGPIDCVHAGHSAVCTFGTEISDRQIQKLLRAGVRKVDFMWDGPSPTEPRGAWDKMDAAAPRLAAVFEEVRMVYLPAGDPGDMDRLEIMKHRREAKPYRSSYR